MRERRDAPRRKYSRQFFRPSVRPLLSPQPLRLKTKLLFLCSRNQWRSPTAEALFRAHPRYEARSAGTVDRARVKLSAGHVGWADVIFAMEHKHAAAVTERFAAQLGDKPFIVPRIPDDYQYMDPDLVAHLRAELAAPPSPHPCRK